MNGNRYMIIMSRYEQYIISKINKILVDVVNCIANVAHR